MFFPEVKCLESKFRTVQNTKKHEKFTILLLFWLVTYHFSIFLNIHRTFEKCFLWRGNIIFKEVLMEPKFRTVQSPKNMKIYDFSTILVCNFSLFIFFTILIQQ